MKKFTKNAILFVIGGFLYCLIEILLRGRTHWSMAIVGGICFLLIGLYNEFVTYDTPLLKQGIIGSCIVTSMEFVSGLILNIYLHWNVWDYSNLPFNFMGQVCLPFSILWIFVSVLAVVVDDWLRYFLFNEEKPTYKLF